MFESLAWGLLARGLLRWDWWRSPCPLYLPPRARPPGEAPRVAWFIGCERLTRLL